MPEVFADPAAIAAEVAAVLDSNPKLVSTAAKAKNRKKAERAHDGLVRMLAERAGQRLDMRRVREKLKEEISLVGSKE